MNEIECARLETVNGEPVSFLGVKLTGDLHGLVFEASVEQRFCNPSDKNVEVVYTFPLPWGAVLMGVDVVLGEKHLTGAVVEKKQAEARYEAALSEGNASIMLEKNHDHSYTLNLGNLAAQENCMITLRYAQTLQFEQRGLRLLIPTVIAPRYGDAVADGRLQPHQAVSHDLFAEYPFDITLRLYGAMAFARVASPSHPVAFAQGSGEQTRMLTVSLGRRGALDRDFVLVIDQLAHDSVVALARDCLEPDRVVALVSFCPRIVAAQRSTAIAVKILVDCSGSMNGDSLDAAKRSLQAVVQQLVKGDRFSLSRFGGQVEHRSRGLWTASETTRLAAQRWVGDLTADMGGTEMAIALSSTFALAQTVVSDVLLVTDGEISAIDNNIGVAKASGHRLFVVGIGSSSAESHLRRLAEATGGACDFVAPGEAVEPAVLRMFARLRSARLKDIAVVWPEGTTPEWVSKFPPSIFDGDTVNVFALLRQLPVGSIRLQGRALTESPVLDIGSVDCLPCPDESDYTLSRMAASVRLASEFSGVLAASSSAAKHLAVAYQLVTDQTNFLLVHQRAESDKPADMPELHKVDQMLAAGWGGSSSVMETGSRSFFETRVIDYASPTSLDWSDVDTPTVWRTVDEPTVKFCMADDAPPPPPLFSRSFDQSIPDRKSRDWVETAHYRGMTPLGLSEFLRTHPVAHWPKTYSELDDIGVGKTVLDWLEIVICSRDGKAIPEAVLVKAFLYLMSRRTTHASLTAHDGLFDALKNVERRLRSLLSVGSQGAVPSDVDARLVEEIGLQLSGMTAEAWPDHIFDMRPIGSASPSGEVLSGATRQPRM